jgi:hypothetical protein
MFYSIFRPENGPLAHNLRRVADKLRDSAEAEFRYAAGREAAGDAEGAKQYRAAGRRLDEDESVFRRYARLV